MCLVHLIIVRIMRIKSNFLLIVIVTLLSFNLAAHNQGFTEFEFVKNIGQWHTNVAYKVQLPEGNIYLENNRIKIQLTDFSVVNQIHDKLFKGKKSDAVLRQHVYTASFVGANPEPEIIQEKVQSVYHNYYIGKDQNKWKSNVPVSHQVRYKNLYNGVDLLIFSHHGSIKYEFHCSNYAASKQVKIQYEGQDGLTLKNGTFLIKTSLGDVSEAAPIVFCDNSTKRDTLESSFVLNKNEITFDIAVNPNQLNQPIVIDPTLIFSTYSGSTFTNFGFTATYDSEGFLYSGSLIFGAGYPITNGAFQSSFQGGSGVYGPRLPGTDVAITKYDTSGTRAIYSTYFGGKTGDEMPHSLVVNSRDELFVYGTTGSTDFPVTSGAYQDTLTAPNLANRRDLEMAVSYPQGSDLFISAFQTNGRQLVASTLIGGSANDGLNNPGPYGVGNPRTLNYNYADAARGEIDIDSEDNVYVVSSTFSNDFPITGNPVFPNYRGGNQDGIIVKFKPELDTLIWSSYYGGVFTDAIYSLAFRKNGNITIAGGTNSSVGMSSGSLPAFSTFQGGRCDGFVAEISSDGQTVVSSTYFGSREYDQAYFVERDRFDNVYIFGQTEDGTGKLIQNAQYFTRGAGQFVTKFTPSIDSIIWSTTFGTPKGTSTNAQPNISPTAFLVDLCNSVYISGWGGSTNLGRQNNATLVTGMDTTLDAYQATTDGSDLYLLVLADDASRKIYASFFGGASANEHVDGGTSRFDRKGKIYQAVCAGCPRTAAGGTSDFPTFPNPGAASNINGAANWSGTGGCNNAVFKMDFLLPAVVAEFQIPKEICTKDSIQLRNLSLEQGATKFKWFFGNGDSSELKAPKVYYDSIGTYEILLVVSDSNSCNLTDSITKLVTLINPKMLQLPNDSICVGDTIRIGIQQSSEYNKFLWLPGNTLDDSTLMRPLASPVSPTEYKLLLNNGICTDTNFLFVQVDSFINADFTIPDSICAPDTLNIGNNSTILSSTNINWSLNGILNDTIKQPTIVLNQTGRYSLNLVLTDSNSCNDKDSALQEILVLSDTAFELKEVLSCNNALVDIGLAGNPSFSYRWETSIGISDSTISAPRAQSKRDTSYVLLVNRGVCVDTITQPILADSIRVQAAQDTVICSNVPSLVIAGKHFGTGINYQWSSTSAFTDQLNTSINDSSARVSYDTLFENTYYFQSASARGCRSADSTKIFVNDFGIEITDSVDLCLNDTTFLTVTSLVPKDTLSVIWTPFEDLYGPNDTTSIKVNPSRSKTYTVDVRTSRNCEATREVHVFVSTLDTNLASLTSSRDTLVAQLFAQLNTEPKGYAYQWSPEAGLNDPNSSSPIAKPDTTTLYTVEIYDPNLPNCTTKRSYNIRVEELYCETPYVYLPNTFTPNGDGENDELRVYGRYIEEMNLQIFNRWGELVFETRDQSTGWDGSFKGATNWPEVFVYQLYVRCIDGQEFKSNGDITLVR